MATNRTAATESTLASQCYDLIQEQIIDGTFAPGQKLKVEELKDLFAMGQSPIREALSRSVASGLVEAEENKGFRVARISEADVRDVYATFAQIEALALEQSIKLGNDNWQANVVSALYRLSLLELGNEPVSYPVWAERNYAFHVSLISGCNSPLLLSLRKDVYRRFDRYCRTAFKLWGKQLELNHQSHKQLADAVLARDMPQAIALSNEHILGALEEVIAILKQNKVI